jgi:hypothetical protein
LQRSSRRYQHIYALLEERAPGAETKTPEEGLAELTRRYFATRGPPAAKDFAKWSGLTVAHVRAGLQTVKSELERVELEGRVFWLCPRSVPEPPPGRVVDLVQGYDEVIGSYGESPTTG